MRYPLHLHPDSASFNGQEKTHDQAVCFDQRTAACSQIIFDFQSSRESIR
jgi:hypothetical protein